MTPAAPFDTESSSITLGRSWTPTNPSRDRANEYSWIAPAPAGFSSGGGPGGHGMVPELEVDRSQFGIPTESEIVDQVLG